mmetsp:Transcript_28222/g.43236  ORF Transcript_28222/g.43236 Transcript_28222/m.43236 type:complete len:234 (+) Transcript_28222:150-851(+)
MSFLVFCAETCRLGSVAVILYQLAIRKDGSNISNTTQEFLLLSTGLLVIYMGGVFQWLGILSLAGLSWIVYTLTSNKPSGRVRYTIVHDTDTERYWATFALPCFLLAFLCGGNFLYSFSGLLDSVALIPQLLILHHKRLQVAPFLKHFIVLAWLVQPLYGFRSQGGSILLFASILKTILVPMPWIMDHYNLNSDVLSRDTREYGEENENRQHEDLDDADSPMMYFSLLQRETV